MNLYEQISDIFPHLVSIRKLEDYITIDVEFPTTWKLPKKYVDEKMVVEQKSDKPNTRFFSFATIFQKEPIDVLFYNLKNIIRYNKEREEKERLFEDKVKELKSFFDKSNLDDLKALEFQIKQGLKIELEDEPEDGENIELVSEGN
jgi:hypothetical protein